ncbi:MAG: DUF6356 family protein [Rhodospirillaceae bacterium]|nr:DUF6356 family protein [Rhodospirillaceae bacterium]
MLGLQLLFCEHPESVNETYFKHLMFAAGFGVRMLVAGLACVVHGLLPCLFERTGSKCICDLYARLGSSGRQATEAKVAQVRIMQS